MTFSRSDARISDISSGCHPGHRQFEEIFTQCADSGARARFVRVLLALAARGLVVLGVRADFYQDCAGLADLGGLPADNQVVVGPLAEADLRRAITLPAMGAGWTVEPGLTELMIADLGLRPGTPGYAPGRCRCWGMHCRPPGTGAPGAR